MTKHNIWSISIIGLLFALLFTPLVVATSLYFPYVTGKVFTFRIITTIAMILWLILIVNKPQFLPKKSCIITVAGLFVLWLAIANFFGSDIQNSFFSNFERMEGWFTHLYLFVYLLILSSVLQSEKIWSWFLNTSIVIANIIALKATFDSQLRTQVFLGNSTYVAIYILFNLFFTVLFLYRLIKKKTKEDALKYFGIIYYISSIILFVYVIFRTQTRGTVLALVFSFILFLILSAISYWKNKKVRIVASILLIVAIAGSVVFWQNRDIAFIQNNPLLARIATISASEGTGKARLVNWGIAIEGIKENPVMGWGQENYSRVFAQKYNPNMYAQEPWFDRTHNAFLDWTIQGGLIALLLYTSLFIVSIYLIKTSSSLHKTDKNILVSLIVAYSIHNIFVFDNYSSYLMFFTLLAYIVYHSNKGEIKIFDDKKNIQAISIFIGILIVVASYFTISKPLLVANNLIDALSEKDQAKSLDIYEKIINKNSFGNTEVGIRLMTEVQKYFSIDDPKVIQRYVDLTTKLGNEFEKTDDVRRLETYGGFLMQIGDVQSSIRVLEKAKSLAPNRQNNLYTLGMTYINANNLDKAKEVFKQAYEVQKENDRARTYYGAVLLLSGDKSGSELIKGYSTKDGFFLSIFSRLKQYKEVIKIREQIKKDNPMDYQNQVSLAVAYYLDKQTAKAILVIKDVQKAVPEFKQQGDYLIKEMQAGRNIIK